jgi:hypothetical protein
MHALLSFKKNERGYYTALKDLLLLWLLTRSRF